MNNYTAYCIDEDGFEEEIDFQAKSMTEAKEKIRQIINEDYCGSLNLKKIVEQIGCWF
tara:strand:+ start:381 stop:554 length:174 start_codon:yes stop_codon:yes gene_type:complete